MRRALREPGSGHQRHPRIGDSMATALALTKGRAAAYDRLQACRRAGALALASAATFVRRWLPS
eukprot:4380069-Alexandrium_andersonii.AAC.1